MICVTIIEDEKNYSDRLREYIDRRRVNIGETIKQQVRKYLKILKKVVNRRYFSCENEGFGLK